MAKASTKGQKIGVLILYVIVLLGLLVGLLIPMDFSADKPFDTSLCMQIPAALNSIADNFVPGEVLIGGNIPELIIAAPMTLYLSATSVMTIDFNAWLTLIYAVVTLLAVICIIPAIVGTVKRITKEEKAANAADSQAVDAANAAGAALSAAGYTNDGNGTWKNASGLIVKSDADGNPIPVDALGQAIPQDAEGKYIIPELGEDADPVTVAIYNYAAAYDAVHAAVAEAQAADAAANEAVAKKKKAKETTYHTAFTLEVLAAIVLILMNFFLLLNYQYDLYNGGVCIPILVAFVVVLVVGFIQRCIASKGSGVVKFILFILSLAAVIIAFFDVSKIFSSGAATVSDAAEETASTIAAGFYGGSGAEGLTALSYFIFYASGSVSALLDGLSTAGWAFYIGSMILAIMLLLNCFLDLMGIYKKTNKFMLVVNQIRYIIELLAVILCVIMVIIDVDIDFGVMLIVCIILAVVSYVINLARLIKFNKDKKKEAAAAQAEAEAAEEQQKEETINTYNYPYPEYDGTGTPYPEYSGTGAADINDHYGYSYYPPIDTPPYSYTPSSSAQQASQNTAFAPYAPVATVSAAQPKAQAQPAVQAAAAAAQPSVQAAAQPAYAAQPQQAPEILYNLHTLYNGPTDSFIAKLSTDEKVEFARVFLERNAGALPFIPAYKVGGNNAKFFSAVIIYYPRIRNLISFGLLDKLTSEDTH
ncbi:MAG: hypothetical protein LUD50_01585 [Clostridia bacterium]|nr:hypothetical protein [Clostridia bacterium]